jgi:hypothetical protein
MTQLRRISAPLLAVVLALTLAIGLAPTLLLAAPAAQETTPAIVGYYESAVIPGNDDTPDLVVGLILYEDGSAEVLSDYDDDQETITEVGTWVDNGDNTLTLTVTGSSTEAYAAPIDLTFTIAEDGSLVNTEFSPEGLILLPAELGNDVISQLPAEARIYQSAVMPAASTPGLQLTLALFDDASLTKWMEAWWSRSPASWKTPTARPPTMKNRWNLYSPSTTMARWPWSMKGVRSLARKG